LENVVKYLIAVLATAVLTPLPLAPSAHADSTDDAFLAAIHSHGINPNDGYDQGAIRLARAICSMRDDGHSTNWVVNDLAIHASALTSDQLKFLVQESQAMYCPEYSN
jgi:hypothetical protein